VSTLWDAPLHRLWDALERRGYQPHGPQHNFRARCPAHDGDNADALHVSAGPDGRALVWCFRCEAPAVRIVERLGLTVGDLFPAGHRKARRPPIKSAQRSDLTGNARTVANVLGALDALTRPWAAMVGCDCPYCGEPGAWLRTSSEAAPHVDCPHGCNSSEFTQALAGRLAGTESVA